VLRQGRERHFLLNSCAFRDRVDEIGGDIAQQFGLGMPLLMGAASTVVLFLAALFIREPGNLQMRRAPGLTAVPAQ